MEHNLEEQKSIWEHPDMQYFIASRNIRPEDFDLIEKLATFSPSLIAGELHNFFSFEKEKSGDALERAIRWAAERKEAEKVRLFTFFKEFFDRYSYYECVHLERVLERLRPLK